MEKIKVDSIDTVVTMHGDKPYYENKYRMVGDNYYHIGYSSYYLDIALADKEKYFELVDSKKTEKTMNEKFKVEYERLKTDLSIGLYDKSLIAFAIQYGRLLAFLELSVFTSIERDNEEDKLLKLCSEWEKRYKGGNI